MMAVVDAHATDVYSNLWDVGISVHWIEWCG